MIRESRIRIVIRPRGRVDVVSRRWIERVPAGDGNRRSGKFLFLRVCSFAESSRVRRGVDGVVRGGGGGGGRGVPGSARTRRFVRRLDSRVPRALVLSDPKVCLRRSGAVARDALASSLVVSETARARPVAAGLTTCVSRLAAEADARFARFALAAPASRAIAAEALVAAVVCEVRPSSVRVPAAAWSESCRDDGVRRRGVRHVVGEDRSRVGRGGSTSRSGLLARVVYAGKHLCGDRERDRRVQSLSRIALGLETRGASHPAPRVAL